VSELNTIDYAIIVFYLLMLMGLGFYLNRRATASIEDYFLGGKRLPWWLLGVSGMSSFLDVAGTMLIVSFLYTIGPRGLFVEFRGGAVLVLAVTLLWAGKWNRRSNVMTGAEWMEYRFGRGVGGQFARVVSAIQVMVFQVGALAYLLKAAGLYLSMFLPYSPSTCALIMVTVATIYTLASGFYGVVYTDLLQSGVIIVAVIGVTAMAVMHVTMHPTDLNVLAERVTGATNWTSAVPAPHVDMPVGKEDYNPLLMFAILYLLKNVVQGAGMGNDAKYYGARNERECGTLTFFWTCLMTVRWPMMMAFAILGLYLINQEAPDQNVIREAAVDIQRTLIQQEHPGTELDLEGLATAAQVAPPTIWARLLNRPEEYPTVTTNMTALLGADWPTRLEELRAQRRVLTELLPPERWQDLTATITAASHPELARRLEARFGDNWRKMVKLIKYEGTVNEERILPAVILYQIPFGLRGLLLVALLAASMSTFDTGVNQSAAYFTRDLYQRFWRPNAPNRELMLATYIYIVAIVAMGYSFAYMTRTIDDIWSWLTMAFGAGMLIPGVLKFYWWRFNAGGVIYGTIFGVTGAVLDRVFVISGRLKESGFFPDAMSGELIGFSWLLILGGIGAVAGSYLTRPMNRDTLREFYRSTRPFGLWGPLKRELEPEVRAAMSREHRNDLLALPFTLAWQITLFLLPMVALVGNWTAFGWCLVIFLIGLAGMGWFWYRNLPPAEAGVLDSPEKVQALLAQQKAARAAKHGDLPQP
jgi:Na+/proline symporter